MIIGGNTLVLTKHGIFSARELVNQTVYLPSPKQWIPYDVIPKTPFSQLYLVLTSFGFAADLSPDTSFISSHSKSVVLQDFIDGKLSSSAYQFIFQNFVPTTWDTSKLLKDALNVSEQDISQARSVDLLSKPSSEIAKILIEISRLSLPERFIEVCYWMNHFGYLCSRRSLAVGLSIPFPNAYLCRLASLICASLNIVGKVRLGVQASGTALLKDVFGNSLKPLKQSPFLTLNMLAWKHFCLTNPLFKDFFESGSVLRYIEGTHLAINEKFYNLPIDQRRGFIAKAVEANLHGYSKYPYELINSSIRQRSWNYIYLVQPLNYEADAYAMVPADDSAQSVQAVCLSGFAMSTRLPQTSAATV